MDKINRIIISLCDGQPTPSLTVDLKMPFEIERDILEKELAEFVEKLHATYATTNTVN